ncbi:hypothetical protein C5S32_03150 [ANME-1 cluster archaeon GoMg1]|nr:hypothetical protein [ANME-1 cluster archaeon GoMg1]
MGKVERSFKKKGERGVIIKMRYLKRGSRGNRRGRGRRLHEEEDPLTGVANLFDVAMIFALGLMVMVLTYMGMAEALVNPEQMKEIIERGKVLEMTPTEELVTVSGDIEKSGTLYVVRQGEKEVYILVNESTQGQG